MPTFLVQLQARAQGLYKTDGLTRRLLFIRYLRFYYHSTKIWNPRRVARKPQNNISPVCFQQFFSVFIFVECFFSSKADKILYICGKTKNGMKITEPNYQELKKKVSELEGKLAETQWLHDKESIAEKEPYIPFYGDVTELNTERTILDNVGKETLEILTSELMDLLDTSVAIYEKNGDYAYGVFNSGWCQLLDAASRKLCNTDDNETALNCGKWFCHNDCWNNSAKAAIISKKSTDIDCPGGMRLFAEPVFADNEVIGVINIGYGNPPTDNKTLKEIADKYSIGFESLKQKALAYNPRPDFIIEIAKKRLKSIAKLIGEIVQRKQSEQALKEKTYLLERVFDSNFDLIALTDLEGNFTLVGKSHEILGYDSDYLIGKNIMDFVHPDDISFVSKEFAHFLQSGENRKVEYRYKRRKGEYLWFETGVFILI